MRHRPKDRRAAWIVAVGMVAAVAGCSSDSAPAAPVARSSISGPEVVAAASDLNREQLAELQKNYARWAGDLETKQAAAVLRAHELNGPRDDCLEAAGVPLEAWPGWKATITSVGVPKWNDGTGASTLPVRFWSFPMEGNAAAVRLERKKFKAPPKKYQPVFAQCAGVAAPAAQPVSQPTPDIVLQLQEKWVSALTEGMHPRPLLDVMTCLERKTLPPPFDVPPGPGGQEWWSIFSKYEPAPDQVPVGREKPSPRWRAYLDAEEALAGAMWECQGDGDRLLAQAVEVSQQFAADHEAEIARAERLWERVRDRASELGWAPNRPLAGLPEEVITD